MDVRVWGVVEDRLIELRVEPLVSEGGLQITGLPERITRTTADRVRAALLNSGLLPESPPVAIHLEPTVQPGATSDLDLALALAVLIQAGMIGAGLRWVLAIGRLGLDGAVHAGLPERATLADVVRSLCRTRVVESERMFGRGPR